MDKTSVVANNTDKATFTARVKDANGNTVSGVSVSWKTTKGTLSSVSSVTDSAGVATVELRNTKAEAATATVTATVRSAEVNADAVTFIADVSTAQIDQNSITTDKTTAVANGSDTVTYSAEVKDAYQNAVPGLTLSWAGNPNYITLGASKPTSSSGIATMTLQGTLATTVTLTAAISGGNPVNAPAIMLTAPRVIISNGQDLTAAQITQVLNTTRQVHLWLANGNWTSDAYFPSAGSASGKSIIVDQKSQLPTNLDFDNKTVVSRTGDYVTYTSDGSNWIAASLY